MDKTELYRRFQGKACKMFPNDTSKNDLSDNHRIKMGMKKLMRDKRVTPAPYILANLSKHHPNYGDTPAQDWQRKNNS